MACPFVCAMPAGRSVPGRRQGRCYTIGQSPGPAALSSKSRGHGQALRTSLLLLHQPLFIGRTFGMLAQKTANFRHIVRPAIGERHHDRLTTPAQQARLLARDIWRDGEMMPAGFDNGFQRLYYRFTINIGTWRFCLRLRFVWQAVQVLLAKCTALLLCRLALARGEGDLRAAIEAAHPIRETQATQRQKVCCAWWLQVMDRGPRFVRVEMRPHDSHSFAGNRRVGSSITGVMLPSTIGPVGSLVDGHGWPYHFQSSDDTTSISIVIVVC